MKLDSKLGDPWNGTIGRGRRRLKWLLELSACLVLLSSAAGLESQLLAGNCASGPQHMATHTLQRTAQEQDLVFLLELQVARLTMRYCLPRCLPFLRMLGAHFGEFWRNLLEAEPRGQINRVT
jgi:hypothetical protein